MSPYHIGDMEGVTQYVLKLDSISIIAIVSCSNSYEQRSHTRYGGRDPIHVGIELLIDHL